jgi:hypothetical protein
VSLVSRALVIAVLGLTLAFATAGCGGADRGKYVGANERLFKRLPTLPGARLEHETSTAYRAKENGPVVGYVTRFDLKLPPGATDGSVSSFFRKQLRRDWRLVEVIDGPVLNFRSSRAFVSINLANARVHVLEIAVDSNHYAT